MIRYKAIDTKARALLAAIDRLALQDLLPTGYKFEFNEEGRILNILRIDPPRIIAQPQFTKSQWYVLLILFASYPHYAPYEDLLACLTLLPVAECRKQIQQIQDNSSQALNRELKPIYSVVSGLRTKLRNSIPALKVRCFHDAGYILASSQLDFVQFGGENQA